MLNTLTSYLIYHFHEKMFYTNTVSKQYKYISVFALNTKLSHK